MNSKYFRIVVSGMILVVSGILLFYNRFSFQKLKSRKKVYVYDTFLGPPNPALLIDDLMYKDSLVQYYIFAEKNKRYTTFNFPLKGLLSVNPCYVTDYTEDSLLVRIVSLHNRGAHFGNYTESYAYFKTVHDSPPSLSEKIQEIQ